MLILNLFAFALPLAAQTVRWNDVPKQSDTWHASAEAARIAGNVLLFQQPNGAWAKNIDMSKPLSQAELAEIENSRGKVQTFIDNGATWTQLRFLARVCAANPEQRFKDAFCRGLDYLLDSQYENGGWPMIHPPPRDGYYKQITFNDGAMIGVMRLLRDAAGGAEPFAFVDAPRRERARKAIDKGLDLILKTQVIVNGQRTVWCAQHDRQTLLPCGARTYELPSLSGSESVGIVEYLMQIEHPAGEVRRAINDAVAWFRRSQISGLRVVEKRDLSLPKGYDRVVVEDASAPPLWARFYDIQTNRPMFVGRDGLVKDRLADIEHERRTGYSYLGSYAQKLLERDYPAWRAKLGP